MANGAGHAATDGKSTFAVILLSGERAPAELAGALGSFSEALEHVAARRKTSRIRRSPSLFRSAASRRAP